MEILKIISKIQIFKLKKNIKHYKIQKKNQKKYTHLWKKKNWKN